jgi:hypothetical protein
MKGEEILRVSRRFMCVLHRDTVDTLEQQQTEKIETEVKDVDRIRTLTNYIHRPQCT